MVLGSFIPNKSRLQLEGKFLGSNVSVFSLPKRFFFMNQVLASFSCLLVDISSGS